MAAHQRRIMSNVSEESKTAPEHTNTHVCMTSIEYHNNLAKLKRATERGKGFRGESIRRLFVE